MKTLFSSALIALTFGTCLNAFAADDKEKATFQSAVYPIINSMKVAVNINKERDSKVIIRLIDTDGHTLTTKKLSKGSGSTNLRFDLNNLEDGIYKVEISDGATTEEKTVKLQTSVPVIQPSRLVSMK